jgi:nucleoside-diphosphate-sugar epimerase
VFLIESDRTLVTGASGFIGSRLVDRLLAQNVVVSALDRRPPAAERAGVEAVVGDLNDPSAVRRALTGVSTLYHLAGTAHDVHSIRDDGSHDEAIVAGTSVLLGVAAQTGVRRVVFVSSLAVYGPGPSDVPRDETAPLRPVTPYGKAKLRAEALVTAFGAARSAHVCCLRPATVYGPGAKGNLPRLVSLIARGLLPPLPEVGNRRSMVHVDDLLDALCLAATTGAAAGGCYNVTDGRAYATSEIQAMVCRAVGRRPPGPRIPLAAYRVLASVGDLVGGLRGRRAPFDGPAFDVLFRSAWFSSARLSRDTGFAPRHILEDAIPEMLAVRGGSP